MTSTILYVRSANPNIPDSLIGKVEEGADCIIGCCNSCEQLIEEIGTRSRAGALPGTVIIDSSFLRCGEFTIPETICMISTFYRSLSKCVSVSIGVVLDGSCTSGQLKDMQSENSIMGVIPCPGMHGMELTVHSIKEILSHHTHWPNNLMHPHNVVAEKVTSGVDLTPRQSEILKLICNRGLSNKRIANLLKISESTVKIHVSAILKEFGVRNRTQLAICATDKLRA